MCCSKLCFEKKLALSKSKELIYNGTRFICALFNKKTKKKNPIKDWWSEPSQRRLKRKAKEKPKDAQPVRIKKRNRISHSHGKKLHEKQYIWL